MMTYKELKCACDEAEKAFEEYKDNIDATWDYDKSYSEYKAVVYDSEVFRNYMRLAEEEKLRRPTYNLKHADEFDIECRYPCRYPINEFIECCKLCMFSDCDGIGYYGTETHRSDIYANPSELVKNARKDFEYIYWYNK